MAKSVDIGKVVGEVFEFRKDGFDRIASGGKDANVVGCSTKRLSLSSDGILGQQEEKSDGEAYNFLSLD